LSLFPIIWRTSFTAIWRTGRCHGEVNLEQPGSIGGSLVALSDHLSNLHALHADRIAVVSCHADVARHVVRDGSGAEPGAGRKIRDVAELADRITLIAAVKFSVAFVTRPPSASRAVPARPLIVSIVGWNTPRKRIRKCGFFEAGFDSRPYAVEH
jgi:hypothetical protein